MSSRIPAIGELRRICQDPVMHREPFYAKIFSRRISIYITKALLYTPISANQVTILGFLLGIAAGTLFIWGNYWYSITGAVLLQLCFILDGVDGEVARYRGTSSLRGQYLDGANHTIANPYIFVGLSFGVYANFHNIEALIFGFSASLSLAVIWGLSMGRLYLLHKAGIHTDDPGLVNTLAKQTSKRNIKVANLLRKMSGKIPMPSNMQVFINAILIGAIFNCLHIILFIFGILLLCELLLRLWLYYSFGFPE
ncbi:hypothetical protein ES703_84354 [subsurface metagenome]